MAKYSSRNRGKRPMFKLSFRYSGGNIDDFLCREPSVCLIEDEMGNFIPAEGQMSRGADESSRALDKMLAAAQFNGNPLNALVDGSAFSDELSMEVPDLGGPEIVGEPEKPVLEETEPPIIDVWEHVDHDKLDAMALVIFDIMQKMSPDLKTGNRQVKPELGTYISAEFDQQSGKFTAFTYRDPILQGVIERDGSSREVDIPLSSGSSIAFIHSHPPKYRGSREPVDRDNRLLSPRDRNIMKAFFEGGKAHDEQKKPFPKTNRKLVAYLITPQGRLRRFTYDHRNSRGEDISVPHRFNYYKNPNEQ